MIILNGQFNQALTSILQASGRYISLFKGNDKSPEQKKIKRLETNHLPFINIIIRIMMIMSYLFI
jgi:hypothetical protein